MSVQYIRDILLSRMVGKDDNPNFGQRASKDYVMSTHFEDEI